MCSSWYHLRYLSPHYDKGPFDDREYNYWMPVDTYTGGIEHATMHLMYTRFFTKAIRDTTGLVEFDEPMTRLFNQGIILGDDSEKMSKTRGNVVNPDALVGKYGADTVRAFLMFIGPWDQGGPWNPTGIEGARKWVARVWALATEPVANAAALPPASDEQVKALRRVVHQTIKRVTADMDAFKHNTVIAALMELATALSRAKESAMYPDAVWGEAMKSLLLMMAPIVPHVSEELWERLGGAYSIHQQAWPVYDAHAAAEDTFTLIVQVNGKVRDRVDAPAGIADEDAKQMALATEGARKYMEGKTARQVIYVKNKLVNIVV